LKPPDILGRKPDGPRETVFSKHDIGLNGLSYAVGVEDDAEIRQRLTRRQNASDLKDPSRSWRTSEDSGTKLTTSRGGAISRPLPHLRPVDSDPPWRNRGDAAGADTSRGLNSDLLVTRTHGSAGWGAQERLTTTITSAAVTSAPTPNEPDVPPRLADARGTSHGVFVPHLQDPLFHPSWRSEPHVGAGDLAKQFRQLLLGVSHRPDSGLRILALRPNAGDPA
jgi:hypothetical protein